MQGDNDIESGQASNGEINTGQVNTKQDDNNTDSEQIEVISPANSDSAINTRQIHYTCDYYVLRSFTRYLRALLISCMHVVFTSFTTYVPHGCITRLVA